MSLFNYWVLQTVRVIMYMLVFALGLYASWTIITLIGDKTQTNPVASLIMMVGTVCITWLIGGGILSLWRIEK